MGARMPFWSQCQSANLPICQTPMTTVLGVVWIQHYVLILYVTLLHLVVLPECQNARMPNPPIIPHPTGSTSYLYYLSYIPHLTYDRCV